MSDIPALPELNEQQKRFCEEYIKDLNATQAAIRSGYSEKSATQSASRLLTYDNVSRYIKELSAERSNAVKFDANTILKELLMMATADISEAYTPEGWLKPLNEIPESVRKLISGLEVNELFDGQGDDKHIIGVAKKIKFADKLKALELLGKHLKLFTDKVEQETKGEMKIIIEDYVSRKKE